MELKYREDGTFTIIQFTDTHIGNMPFHEDDYQTFHLIEKVLNNIDADLVIHTGDIIWSEGVKNANIVFERTLEYFNQAQIPMAITFGNHDAEEIITRSDLRQIFEDKIDCIADKKHSMIVDDRECYTLEIMNSENSQIENVLYIIDSGAAAPLPIGTYDWNQPEQVNWFATTANNYRKGDGIKRNLVFQHIPIPEYWQAAEHIISGVNHDTNEAISAPYINTGMFANMVIDGETWGMFVGHDHENNFDGIVHDLHLVYGNISGYQAYGDEDRGVRVIQLNQNTKEINTYTVKINEINE